MLLPNLQIWCKFVEFANYCWLLDKDRNTSILFKMDLVNELKTFFLVMAGTLEYQPV